MGPPWESFALWNVSLRWVPQRPQRCMSEGRYLGPLQPIMGSCILRRRTRQASKLCHSHPGASTLRILWRRHSLLSRPTIEAIQRLVCLLVQRVAVGAALASVTSNRLICLQKDSTYGILSSLSPFPVLQFLTFLTLIVATSTFPLIQ